MTITIDDEKHENFVYLLDDVVNALANYKSLQRRTSDTVGSMLTSVLIEQVKTAIRDLVMIRQPFIHDLRNPIK